MSQSATVTVVLRGQLTRDTLRPQLSQAEEEIDDVDGKVCILFDCTEMTGYAPDARSEFVSWHQEHKDQVLAVAIVTDRSLWRMVISAMALAARQDMRAFEVKAAAMAWLTKECERAG